MNVFITGLRSFVGSTIAHHLRTHGHHVSGSSREGAVHQGIHRLVLGEICPADLFVGQDAIIHCAWNVEARDPAFNVVATRMLADAARKSGVLTQVFISSLSATADSQTSYGRSKFEAEQLFNSEAGDVIIRPGLIVGNGGLFRRTFDFVRKNPVIPLIRGGRFKVPLVDSVEVAECIRRLLDTSPRLTRPYLLFHPVIPTQRDLILAICEQKNWRRLMLPIPAPMALSALGLAEKIWPNAPIKSANLRAALQNRCEPADSDLSFVLGTSPSFIEILSLIKALR